jgi:hypothetical protein
MSDLQPALNWQTLTIEAVAVPAAQSQEPEPFDLDAIAKTVFKLAETTPQLQPLPQPELSVQVKKAVQRLVAIIAKLRSPEGGWPTDLEPTVENLLPYVTEEAYEVLDTLHIDGVAPQVTLTQALEDVLQTTTLPGYLLVEELIPRLLWYVARGSYDLMRLLCGVEASVFQPGQGWQTGIVRLVAILDAKFDSDRHWALDLATYQPPTTVLTEQVLIRSEHETFCPQPTWVASLTQHLLQQIQTVTPEALTFIEPAVVELLAPSQGWQTCTLQLQLAFEFTAGTQPAIAEVNAASVEQTGDPNLSFKFTTPTVLEQYLQSLVQQPLDVAIAQLPAPDTWNRDRLLAMPTSQALATIVEAAALVAEAVPQAKDLGQDCATHAGVVLDDWLPQLLWQLTSSSYEVMHWIGGLTAKALPTGDRWQAGTLRLWTVLSLKTTEHDWYFDISTGQNLKAMPSALAASAMIQLDVVEKSPRLQRVEPVMTRLIAQIQTSTPLMQQLMEGIEVHLLTAPEVWQRGLLKLEVGLELMSDLDWCSL